VAEGRIVGTRAGVFVAKDANVVATASSTGKLGGDVLEGIEHDDNINIIKIFKKRFMRRLYSFSEQIDIMDVLRVKERR